MNEGMRVSVGMGVVVGTVGLGERVMVGYGVSVSG